MLRWYVLVALFVAPIVGAWIESLQYKHYCHHRQVAPIVGAWIEINNLSASISLILVAPIVGAWIEMNMISTIQL